MFIIATYYASRSIFGLGRWRLKKDCCDRSSSIRKDAKPEEYDMNRRRNDVYDGIWCAFD